MRALVAALMLMTIAPPATAAGQADSRSVLHRFLDARSDHFASLKGAPDAPGKSWHTTAAPPGMRCEVLEHWIGEDVVELSCINSDDRLTKAQGLSMARDLEHLLSQLQPGWVWTSRTIDGIVRETDVYAGPSKTAYVVTFDSTELDAMPAITMSITDRPRDQSDPVDPVPRP